jgi:hypothetical protein
MLYTILDNFYLSDEQLEQSPSRVDGIDSEVETTLRIYGCQLIQEACILLDLPQVAAATGQVLLQRFFCKKSMREFDVQVSSWWSLEPHKKVGVTHTSRRRKWRPLAPGWPLSWRSAR